MISKKRVFFFGASIITVVIGGITLVRFSENRGEEKASVISREGRAMTDEQATPVPSERVATVYRSLTCGCCLGYSTELEKQGFVVRVESLREKDMDVIKKQYGIPSEKQSCHTTVIGDYFVEGHVPFEAIEKLLAEKPNIDGIGLPGMPLGTPGMPGMKSASYEIYEKISNEFSKFMTL